jgi:hypothetical protein
MLNKRTGVPKYIALHFRYVKQFTNFFYKYRSNAWGKNNKTQFIKIVVTGTLKRWIKAIANGNVSAQPMSGWPRSVCASTFINKIKSNPWTNQKFKSVRYIVSEEGYDPKTVHTMIREDSKQIIK